MDRTIDGRPQFLVAHMNLQRISDAIDAARSQSNQNGLLNSANYFSCYITFFYEIYAETTG